MIINISQESSVFCNGLATVKRQVVICDAWIMLIMRVV